MSYETLRAELNRGLDLLEAEGQPIEAAMVEVLRLGLVLSVAAMGPAETAAKVSGFLDYMAAHFPWAMPASFTPFPQPAGTA